MDWFCPQDQQKLTRIGDTLQCPHCDYRGICEDEVIDFVGRPSLPPEVPPDNPMAVDLYEMMRTQDFAIACGVFCKKYGSANDQLSSDWRFLLPTNAHSTILEIGTGCGFDTVALAANTKNVIGLAPNAITGKITRTHADLENVGNIAIAAIHDLTALPLASNSVDIICAEDVGLAGFGVDRHNFHSVIDEFRRVLSDNGTVFLGVTNAFGELQPLLHLAMKMRVRPHTMSMNRLIKKSPQACRIVGMGRCGVTRCMRRAAFGRPIVYCPFPDEENTSAVLSAQNRLAFQYFFRHVQRRRSLKARVALSVAGCLASLNLSRRFLPYDYMLFRKQGCRDVCNGNAK
jgi:SAM-dependent methyltransferase